MVSLDRFETFRAVVDCGSLSAAADTLGQTRAVVSFNLKRLEAELGVSLLTCRHSPGCTRRCRYNCRPHRCMPT